MRLRKEGVQVKNGGMIKEGTPGHGLGVKKIGSSAVRGAKFDRAGGGKIGALVATPNRDSQLMRRK